MPKIVMSIKTDAQLKKRAQKIAEELGFRLGTLLNAFMRQLVKEKEVFFSTATYKPNARLRKELAKIEKDIQEGKDISPGFSDANDFLRYL